MSDFPQAPNRRAVYAFVAVAEAPMPERVGFGIHPDAHIGQTVEFYLDSGSDLLVWAGLLGIPASGVRRHLNAPGTIWINSAYLRVSGWFLNLTAYDPAGPKSPELDAETRTQLVAVAADESEQPDGAL